MFIRIMKLLSDEFADANLSGEDIIEVNGRLIDWLTRMNEHLSNQ